LNGFSRQGIVNECYFPINMSYAAAVMTEGSDLSLKFTPWNFFSCFANQVLIPIITAKARNKAQILANLLKESHRQVKICIWELD
jgi:hypothetical protein